jgi:hypothetical protein
MGIIGVYIGVPITDTLIATTATITVIATVATITITAATIIIIIAIGDNSCGAPCVKPRPVSMGSTSISY